MGKLKLISSNVLPRIIYQNIYLFIRSQEYSFYLLQYFLKCFTLFSGYGTWENHSKYIFRLKRVLIVKYGEERN